MKKKIGLMVMLVIAAVAVVSVVSVASAQDATPPAAPTTGQEQGQAGQQGQPPIGNGSVLRQLLQIVADDLKLQPQDLLQQMRGKTLAQVIQANNGDVTKITADITEAVTTAINQAVTNGQITQDRANQILSNLSTTITNALQGNGNFGGRGLGGQQRPGRRPAFRQDMLGADVNPLIKAAADATHLTTGQIGEQIRGGKTLSEVITANGGDPASVENTALTTATQALDKFRTNGSLTQDQENAMVNGLKAFYDAVLNGEFRQQQPQTTPESTAVAPV